MIGRLSMARLSSVWYSRVAPLIPISAALASRDPLISLLRNWYTWNDSLCATALTETSCFSGRNWIDRYLIQSRTNKDDKSNQSFRVPPKTIGIDADSKELSVDQVWAKSIEPFLGKCQICKFDPQNIGQTVKKLAKIPEKCAIDSFW